MDDKVKSLKQIFVDIDEEVIKIILNDVGGNSDRAVDNLLQMCMTTESSSKPTEKKDVEKVEKVEKSEKLEKVEKELTQEEKDILFAKQLQEQLNMDSGEDTDLAFARKLQAELNKPSYPSYIPTYTPVHHHHEPEEKFDSSMTITDFLTSVGQDELKEIVDGIKEQMIPLVAQQLQKVSIPSINQEIDAPKLGPVSFGCDQIALSEVDVPSEKVNVTFEGHTIRISICDISASLKQFEWFYRKEKFPKLKDNGHANASLSETSITATLVINGASLGSASINVSDCEVKVGKLDIKIGGTMASFIYNIIISAFSSSIRNAIETALQDMIREAITENATEFLS